MVKTIRCLMAALALSALLWTAPVARAAEPAEPYIQRMIEYYRFYQEDAEPEIGLLLDYITDLDPEQGELWRQIMTDWSRCRSLELQDTLPDGLPEDDSLCIVVLGYQLDENGGMRPELKKRMETALAAAEKYPNAYVAVTGGATASGSGNTEAGVMGKWLTDHGLAPQRLILEERAMSTMDNALYTYGLLAEKYPSVTSVAIVTSSYHAPTGCVFFQTVFDWNAQTGQRIDVVASAVCAASGSFGGLETQAQGICRATGIYYDRNAQPPAH